MKRALLAAGITALMTVLTAAPVAAAQARPPVPPPDAAAQARLSVPPPDAAAAARARSAPPPLPPGKRPAGVAAAAVTSFYATGSQLVTSEGVEGLFDVAKPTLAAADNYSLVAITAQSADARQTIQVGWNVDRAINGDAEPHIFVYHYVDGKETCYNGCGFVPYDAAEGLPGTRLAPGSQRWFGIQHFEGNWWVSTGTTWMGYFPDSRWGGRFTQTGLVQVYGNVLANSATTCTDMGNGQFGTVTGGARVRNLRFFGTSVVPAFAVAPTHPAAYTVAMNGSTEFRYGGPGYC